MVRRCSRLKLMAVCAPAHPPLAAMLQVVYEQAYFRLPGDTKNYPCHPDVALPITDSERRRLDTYAALRRGGKEPIYF
jgi:hypothetical protein